ncbi:hypothetical protein [Agromyces bauzanensis]
MHPSTIDRFATEDVLQIAGLPLHPLLVHAVVVPTPLTVLALLLGTFGPVPAVARHQQLGEQLLPWAIALFAVAAAQWAWFRYGDARCAAARPPVRGPR